MSPPKRYKCSDCEAAFSHKRSLQMHVRKHTGEISYKCEDCGATFAQKGGLQMHVRTHTGEKPFTCSECNATFAQKGNLQRHELVHTGIKSYPCESCDAAFAEKRDLERHVLVHTGIKSFMCVECGSKFKRKDQLQRHALYVHRGVKPSFKCPECGTEFARKGDLLRHAVKHAGDKPYSCKECGAAFVRQSHLTCHVRIHVNEKSYSCTLCSASFKDEAIMRKHDIIHTTHKSSQCSECGVMFGLIGDLAKHTCNQPCEMTRACPYCGLYYLEKESLDDHIRVDHPSNVSGVNQLTCDDCGVQFSQKCLLQRHALVHTQVAPNQCDNCGVSFAGNGELALHSLTHCENLIHADDCDATLPDMDRNWHMIDEEEFESAFKCDECGSSFESNSDFDEHKLTHTLENLPNNGCRTAVSVKGKSQNCADVCTADTTCVDSVLNKTMHNDAPTSTECSDDIDELTKDASTELVPETPCSCELCGATFTAPSILYEHRLLHTADESHQCFHCKAVFCSKSKLEEHIHVHSSETPFSCLDCGINFRQVNDLNDHLRSHHPIDKVTALPPSFGATLEVNANVRKRPLAHFNVKPHKCEECTAAFASKRELWDHIPVHSCEMTYTCQDCGIAFADLVSLTNHVHTHHPTKKEDNCKFDTLASTHGRASVLMPYQCEHCGCEFLQESELIDHVHIHTSEMTYACQDCGVVFADVGGLNAHILSRHPGDKVYYKGRGDLNRMTSNINADGLPPVARVPRPFKCDICGSEFTRKTHLTRHGLIHTGEKPYKCDECGIAFGRKSHLQRHTFIHSGLKPFVCDHCGMAFGRRSHLKRHSQKHPESFSKTISLPPTPESSQTYSEQPTLANHTVAFPGMPPHSIASPTLSQHPTSALKQALERDINYSSPPFSSNFNSPPDPSQLPSPHPHWNLFQPMLSFNVHEALNWSRQSETHSAYPNLKHHQKPVA